MALMIRFPYGEISQTVAAITHINYGERVKLIERHLRGDWSEMADCDKQNNERAAREGGEIISLYFVNDKFMIIRTNAERTITEVMMSDEAG